MPDLKGFLGKDTAGLPNWAWLLVVAGGIAAAYLVPKFLNQGSTPASTSNTADTSGTSGLGLAIDPTTGLPYAVEGLVPSGATAGSSPIPPIPAPQGPGGVPIPPVPAPPLPPPPPPPPGPVPGKDIPLIPWGQYNGPSYSNLAPNTFFTWANVKYKLVAGAGNRLWGIDPNGKQILLYGDRNAYNPPQGGGGPSSSIFPINTADQWSGVRQVRIAGNGTGY